MKTQDCTCCKRPYLPFEFTLADGSSSPECSRCRAIEKKVKVYKEGEALPRRPVFEKWEPIKQDYQRGDASHIKSFGARC